MRAMDSQSAVGCAVGSLTVRVLDCCVPGALVLRYPRHPPSGQLLFLSSGLSRRQAFGPFCLKPRKHVLREVPLRLPAQIKFRHSKPHNLSRLDLEPFGNIAQV